LTAWFEVRAGQWQVVVRTSTVTEVISMIRNGFSRIPTLVTSLMTIAISFSAAAAETKSRVDDFKLENGMEVIVIPDHRAPVVTHMVFYRAGAADEPAGNSGIAHFLEHLMFKSTEKYRAGAFSNIVERLGGELNAFTTQDVTAYHERVAKEQLPRMMEMEAERMVNLRLADDEIRTERDVVLEERRMRYENSPAALLNEQMEAALYQNHPYRIPVIGWQHEVEKLSRPEAAAFYKRYYAPNNAILVVAGDITADEVKKLAGETYGKLKPVEGVGGKRMRPMEPPSRVARRMTLTDERAGQPSLYRYYLTPSYGNAPKGDAEALDVLSRILAEGATSRLYRDVVVDKQLSASTSGQYDSSTMDSGEIVIQAVAANNVELGSLEAAIDAVIEDVKANGVTDSELSRAKTGLIADYVYENDNQASLARRYGWGRAIGYTIDDMEHWPDRIRAVTSEDVKRVAKAYLDIRASVTGWLMPPPRAAAGRGPVSINGVANKRS